MAANLSKKFALLCCCLMTMQALRLVISTAGFCVVRFHIDCELFNIFISRLVNAVMMSSLLGNWLGDLIVFAATGKEKLIGLMVANWTEFFCFCTALYCIMHTECGHLTGFYWSMVSAYFWWKVSEAPTVSIAAPDAVDYYYAGFTLSGVWASCLKGLVMWCVNESVENQVTVNSTLLDTVNVTVVGTRSIKLTIDYRAAKWLYITTILLTFLMCLSWSSVTVAVFLWPDGKGKEVTAQALAETLKDKSKRQQDGSKTGVDDTNNKVTNAVRGLGKDVKTTSGALQGQKTWDFGGAQVATNGDGIKAVGEKVEITIERGTKHNAGTTGTEPNKIALAGVVLDMVAGVTVDAGPATGAAKVKVVITVNEAGVLDDTVNTVVVAFAGIAFGGVLAVPGALFGAGVGRWLCGYAIAIGSRTTGNLHWTVLIVGVCGMALLIGLATVLGTEGRIENVSGKGVAGAGLLVGGGAMVWRLWRVASDSVNQSSAVGGRAARVIKGFTVIFSVLGGLAGMAAGVTPCVWKDTDLEGNKDATKWRRRIWVEAMKWPRTNAHKGWDVTWAPMIGLGVGTYLGTFVGLCIGARAGSKKSGFWAGALVGSFLGLITGEMLNGAETWLSFAAQPAIVCCGFFIVVSGLGTVYSIYPGMAPCSITQFKYFNIIDIWILILSSIGPIVIMGLDLAEADDKLGLSILEPGGTTVKNAKWLWAGLGVGLTFATLFCEIIVISVLHYPGSKLADKVTNSPVLACSLTIMMVTFQLTSTGIGFACVAAGGIFNDGINNVLSTLTLWAIECCGVLGEGYLTELKKYEPGKWPTQGLGKWDSFNWWRSKAFGNAWQIWCCIGTTDLRRDIMLCRQ